MADDEKILGIKKSELTELVRQILAEMPTSLPANGGNADTVGGIQISDIRQITRNAIQTLPTPPIAECDYFVSNADSTFPYYFGNLSIRYGSYTAEFVAIYQTTGDDKSIWYNLYLGGWVGWKEIYTSGNKPYIVGDVSVKAGESTAITNHNFMPSAVFWWENKSSVYPATSFDTTSFNMAVASSIDRTINYIIFK